MLVVQVWLVVTVSLLGVLMLVMGGQAAWGLLRSGRVAVAPDAVAADSVPADSVPATPVPDAAVTSRPAAVEPVVRPMVGSTAP